MILCVKTASTDTIAHLDLNVEFPTLGVNCFARISGVQSLRIPPERPFLRIVRTSPIVTLPFGRVGEDSRGFPHIAGFNEGPKTVDPHS